MVSALEAWGVGLIHTVSTHGATEHGIRAFRPPLQVAPTHEHFTGLSV